MTITRVKICGIKTPDDIRVAARCGVTWAGLTFFPASPRNLGLEAAAAIAETAENENLKIKRVALIVDADDAAIADIIKAARPYMLQCHGGETPERCSEIKNRFGVAVMKAIQTENPDSLEAARAYDGICDMLLFDAPPQADTARPGGTGNTFDWTLMQNWQGSRNWMLAGGLTPDNVAAAIAASGAPAVDVASGVESALGIKDPVAIEHFVNAATMG